MRRLIKNIVYLIGGGRLIRKGAPGAVYITYDDGPDPHNTPAILEVLRRYGVKATFFMVGRSMEEHPEIVRAVIEDGHRIGYHSYEHESARRTSLAQFRLDLSRARALAERFDYPLTIYRPPFGDLSPLTLVSLFLAGWKVVMWSRDCGDSFEDLEQVKRNIAAEVIEDGDILLFHDDYPRATELIESVLQDFLSAGYECKPL